MRRATLPSALLGALLYASGLVHAAPDYFRLEPGSVRVYRAQTSEDGFTIRVGSTGVMHNGHVHYSVTGYVNRAVLAYHDETNGALYYLDQDTDKDILLTSVEKGPGWFQASQRLCDQEGQVEDQPVRYAGPSGQFTNALAIHYRTFGCADAGIASERYVENLGMVQRTMQTFAGPVSYDLVHASIGPISVTESPNVAFSIGIRKAFGPSMIADLRFRASGESAVLQMASSQEYEVVLRNAKGDVVWRWSDGKGFTPQLRNRSVRELSYQVEIPLQFYGILLHEGVYTVEAWLATVQERRYAASMDFVYKHPPVPGEQK